MFHRSERSHSHQPVALYRLGTLSRDSGDSFEPYPPVHRSIKPERPWSTFTNASRKSAGVCGAKRINQCCGYCKRKPSQKPATCLNIRLPTIGGPITMTATAPIQLMQETRLTHTTYTLHPRRTPTNISTSRSSLCIPIPLQYPSRARMHPCRCPRRR